MYIQFPPLLPVLPFSPSRAVGAPLTRGYRLLEVRKPYTITKQRERWTDDEHRRFLEALKLYGRAWRRIEEFIGTKTAVQIRSHAQKFFSKVVRDTATGGASSVEPIDIPPPRPKRKPVHPYPRKLRHSVPNGLAASAPEERSPSPVPSLSGQEHRSPTSVLSAAGSDAAGASGSTHHNPRASPDSPCKWKTDVSSQDFFSSEGTSSGETTPTSLKLFGRTVLVAPAAATNSPPLKDGGAHGQAEQESQPQQRCEWNLWPWGMMPPQMIFCPPLPPELTNVTEAAAMASLPWWASLQFPPVNPCQVNPPQKESSRTGSCAADENSGEETGGASSENEGRGFVPYRRCLAERKAGQLKPAEGIRLCL
ncbi:unnamed protein product [Spirodela intermedia]|uniref:Uncharacterized protein n=1 Tax=Spirodela intermedia TaxID=51605 RepID=A0A7I8J9H8_SPIIN|nr:unnamed protein product [Spirodela intermedia]CAA6666641.1 unnamed protein product [Spirodela intermedia]